ncbi:MAG: Repressor CsoR of the copZA operon, partial [uncultured Rubellimicrobium sp.]
GSRHERDRARRPPRLHGQQGRLPQADAPHRGPGQRHRPDGRRGEVLHRHPHPGLGRHEGPAGRRAGAARRAHGPLRARRGPRRLPRGRGQAARGLRRHRPPRPF